jgi:FkbM family methyltransferase
MVNNFVKQVIENGGSIHPLLLPSTETGGTGIMNPSIYIDGNNILCNIRHVNYTLYHCEGEQLFGNRHGPLAYLNPENDIKLRTNNFLAELNSDFSIKKYNKVDTSKLDIEPVWEFIGLEDARVVRWNGKLWYCGVRRDTKTNGEGRMELSEIEISKKGVKEINRYRIEPPNDPNSYCEKNWMPVIDMPFHFVKWTNPTEVVKVDINTGTSQTIVLKNGVTQNQNFRGGSHIIPFKGGRMCIIHEVDLWKNKLQQKDAKYTHRFIVWDNDWNIKHISEPFSFMDGEIEFCTGLTEYNNNLLITFGFQDNAAYLLKMPIEYFEKYTNIKFQNKKEFEWGLIENNKWFREILQKEIFEDRIYERFFNVEKDDVVVDVGASVGPFTYSILNKNPKQVFCLEPHSELFKTLNDNVLNNNVICINKGIMDVNEHTTSRGLYDETAIQTWEKENQLDGLRFDTFIEKNNISKIDFLKVDCEGGEYSIFTQENFNWIKNNIFKISGEFHLTNEELKSKFRLFRDTYLTQFPNIQIFSMDGIDIKWDLFNDTFIEYYSEILVYIDNRKSKKEYWRTTEYPTLEITTSIPPKGCVVDCAFCPQRLLMQKYDSVKTLTYENFVKVIDKLPKQIRITFSGFTEPFLNKKTSDMILYAHSKGHKISVFTTGVGLTIEDIKKIKHIDFDNGPNSGFCLHLPDEERIAKHPITPKYIETIEYIKSIENEIKGFYVMSMGNEIHNSVRHIYPTAHVPTFWSRAGNLLGEAIIKPELEKIKDRFNHMEHGDKNMTCNCIETLYHNVLLPDGRVSLCCMDYGLEQILGNLFEQEYDDIIPVPFSCFNLCSHCENGIEPKKLN